MDLKLWLISVIVTGLLALSITVILVVIWKEWLRYVRTADINLRAKMQAFRR